MEEHSQSETTMSSQFKKKLKETVSTSKRKNKLCNARKETTNEDHGITGIQEGENVETEKQEEKQKEKVPMEEDQKNETEALEEYDGEESEMEEEEERFLDSIIGYPKILLIDIVMLHAMEGIVKKYQQKFRKLKEEMSQWDELQSKLLSQFRNASSIIERLQVIQNPNNYGVLNCIGGIEDDVLRKQMETLESILLSMNKTLGEFHGIVFSLEKIVRDSRQLVKGGSIQVTPKRLQQRIGIKPCLADCLDGLRLLYEMHQSEYLLKSSIISTLPVVVLKPSSTGDVAALQQLLVGQPNIPKEEVQFIFDIVFAEEIC